MERTSPRLRFSGAMLIALLVAGFLLWLATLCAEFMAAPPALQPVTLMVTRTAYMTRLPVMVVMESFVQSHNRHYAHPHFVFAVSSFLAPFVWLFVAFVAWRFFKAVAKLSRVFRPTPTPNALTRRAFLVSAASAVAIPGTLGGYSVLVEPQRVRLARYTIAMRDLPPALDGFRIVHISDTHYGPFISLPYIRAVIEQANALQGDLVILTGDYVHKTPLAIGAGVDVLKRVKARHGVVATLGNHDHWEGADAMRAAFAEIKLPLIDNARRFVTRHGIHDEPIPGESICIGGTGDLWEDKTRFDLALANAPDAMPRILLAHNPDTAEIVEPGMRIDLMCSGHTHGGQVWVPGFGTPVTPSAYGQKYAGGLCQGPRCPVLVSRGVGMAIMPVRFRVPPEIGEITLVTA
ncbi:MAG: metallophosphoesterase [Candidatus Hydrogenedentes bacterium]|nr:metallophosphoesterase [Candidatus Hydrogenedentota bacterium]